MCGICGMWSRDGIRDDVLRRMADTLYHRGPDDEGYFIGSEIGLANRRLSIIDIAYGHQPMENEDGSLRIVFNGEIYNYLELQRRLRANGHELRTASDTEVILHLYEEKGIRCVEDLNGMFAFALWDEREQRLFMARDAMGQKPFYYCWNEGAFLFASEIKALLAATGRAVNLDVLALHHYISLRCIPDEMTLFQGISKLPAGHIMVLEGSHLQVEPYWNIRYWPKVQGSGRDIRDQLESLLLDTVQRHMLSDAPLGAFLSGGIDSSLIVAMMSKLSNAPVKTFSIGVHELGFDELPYARMVAERYATEHHELVVEADLVQSLPKMIWHMDEPVDPFAFGVYSAAGLAGEHVKVVLGGDGGDEIFAGYDRYLGHRLVDYYALIPEPIRRGVLSQLIQRLPDNFAYNNRVQKLRWLDNMSDTNAARRYAQSASYLRFSHAQKAELYTDELWHELGPYDSFEKLVAYFDADNAAHPIDKMLYTDVRTRLADHLLMIGDRMTMAHGVEGRSPYVDQRVVEFVARIPAKYKLHGRTLKYIQREVARKYLPDSLVNRPKKGFGFPLAHWFQNELRPLLVQTFEQSRLVEAGYLRRAGLMNLVEEHGRGQVDHNYRLWLLLNLELWYRLFVEQETQTELTYFLGAAIHGSPATLISV